MTEGLRVAGGLQKSGVHPGEPMMELARKLATRPVPVLRNTQTASTRFLRKAFEDALGYGLALEGVAALQTRIESGS